MFWQSVFLLGGVGFWAMRLWYVSEAGRCQSVIMGRSLLRWPFWLASVVLPLLWVLSGAHTWLDLPLPAMAAPVGVLMVALASWLFWRAHKDALAVQPGASAMPKTGVYKRIRHPLCAALWLFALAQPLLLDDAFIGMAGLVVWAVLYGIKVRQEETQMLAQLGLTYQMYMSKTGRVWPSSLAN